MTKKQQNKQQAKQETAYSYQRFSSGRQSQGDSIRRQNESAISYAIQHNLKLDESTTIKDLGVSAFKNANMESNLGTFIKGIEDKKIPTPCHLLLESLDRYSRRPAIESLFSLYSQLVNKGVTVHIIKSGHIIDKESLLNPLSIIIPLIEFSRSHDESHTKSLRLKAAWENKRKTASINNPLTKICPLWIKIVNGKYVIDKKNGAIIKQIIELAMNGKGYSHITRYANMNKIELLSKISNKWLPSTVKNNLTSKALIGIHEYTTIDESTGRRVKSNKEAKLFPSLITDDEFYKLQGILNKRSKKAGREGNTIGNIFSNAIDFDDKSTIRIRQGHIKNISSSNSMIGLSKSKSFPYTEYEIGILVWLTMNYVVRKDSTDTISIDSIESQIDINKAKLDKITKAIEETEDINSMTSLIDISKKLQDKVNELNINLANEKIKHSNINSEDELFTINERMNLNDYDSRAKMRMALSNIIDSIKVSFTPIGRNHRNIHVMVNMKDKTSHYLMIDKDRGKEGILSFSKEYTGKNYNNDEHFKKWIEDGTMIGNVSLELE